MVSRRYKAGDFPDVILIDGGKGQLSAVKDIFPDKIFISLAKREERLYTPAHPEGIVLDLHTELGKLLVAMRDYAHHFAVSYHTLKRSKKTFDTSHFLKTMSINRYLLFVFMASPLYTMQRPEYEVFSRVAMLPPEVQCIIYARVVKKYVSELPSSFFLQSMCITGHPGSVTSTQFSPDGKQLVSAYVDKTVRVWQTATGKLLRQLEGHTNLVSSAQFSPNGTEIVSASDDRTVRVWSAATGNQLRQLEGHTSWVNSAQFSPDGTQIVSASADQTIRIWSAATGNQLRQLEGHTGCVNSAQFSPNGTEIVSASDDRTVRVWSAATGNQLRQLKGHTGSVNSAQFSPDGTEIVSASHDKTVRVWDSKTGNQLRQLEGHTCWVRSAQFSPDGKQIVSASDDRTVRVWTTLQKLIKTGTQRSQSDHPKIKFIADLFLYKAYLRMYYPKVNHITFAGLATFLNKIEQKFKNEDERKLADANELKEIYWSLDKPTKLALRTIFDTDYQKT